MIEQREEERRPHLARGLDDEVALAALGIALAVLVQVLHHHHRGVDHHADGDGDAAEAHDVRVDAEPAHADEGDEHADRDGEDRHEGRAQVQQEDDADQRHHQHLLDQLVAQGVDRALDELRAVVGDVDLHALGQAVLELGEPLLDPVDHLEGVLAEAQQHDAGDDLALAVHVDEAATHLGAQLDARDLAQQDRCVALRIDGDGDGLEIVERLDVALAANHELGLRHLDQAPAGLDVGALDRLADLRERHAEGAQLLRIDLDLVLAHEAADRGHLGDTLETHQVVAQVPVLDGAQLGQIQSAEVGRARELALRDAPIAVAVEGLDEVVQGVGLERLGTAEHRALLDAEELAELCLGVDADLLAAHALAGQAPAQKAPGAALAASDQAPLLRLGKLALLDAAPSHPHPARSGARGPGG